MSYTQIKRLLNEIKELKEENQLLKYIIKDCLNTYDGENWCLDIPKELEIEIRNMEDGKE